MIEAPRPIEPESVGRTAQLIVGSLMAGVVLLSCVAFFVTQGEPAQSPMLAFIGIGFGALMLLARFTVPTIVVNSSMAPLQQVQVAEQGSRLAGLYLTKTIIGAALLEGAALFNVVAYIVEKQLWSCGVAACLLGAMAISFPSQAQFESWADDRKRELPS